MSGPDGRVGGTDSQKGFFHRAGRLALAVLILGTALLAGGSLIAVRMTQAQTQAEPLPVTVVAVGEQDTFLAEREFAGRIVPQRTSDLAFELGGKVIALLADDGETVIEGQPVARLDTEQLLNRRAELEAQRSEIRAEVTRTASTLRRTEELVENGFSTRQALDDIRAARDAAGAQLQQIEAALQTVETDLEKATLVAPFTGEIVRRYVDEGTVVQSGAPIFRLNESGILEARIGIPTPFRNRLTIGERYTISAGALEAEGTVTTVVSDINTQTGTLTVILQIEDDPGFVARDLVRLTLDEEIRDTGIWVPAAALNESLRGLWSVFVLEPDAEGPDGSGTIVRKDVEVVHIEEARVYVRGTLEDGDLVVASGPFRFVPGQKVRGIEDTIPGIGGTAVTP